MTPREKALLLRLCACEMTREERSIIVLRRILGDLGWSEEAMDAATARIRASFTGLYKQSQMFEKAA